MSAREGIENYDRIQPYVLPEVQDAFDRAVAAGARPPLWYAGAGQYGIVLCDHWGRAWKVGRVEDIYRPNQFMLDSVLAEYEWLMAAAGSGIERHVAQVYAVHPDQLVLERECVEGDPGSWGDDRKLSDLHNKIEREMIPRGWTAPEFKENSYIIRPDGTPVLVDISMVMRVGRNLVGFVEDVLAGRRKTHERFHDLAFYLLSEMRHGTVPREVAAELLGHLAERDPEIRRSFQLP